MCRYFIISPYVQCRLVKGSAFEWFWEMHESSQSLTCFAFSFPFCLHLEKLVFTYCTWVHMIQPRIELINAFYICHKYDCTGDCPWSHTLSILMKWMLVEMLLWGQRILKTFCLCRCIFSHECKVLNKSPFELISPVFVQMGQATGRKKTFSSPFPYLLWVILGLFEFFLTHSWRQSSQCRRYTRRQPVHQEKLRALEEGHDPAAWSLTSPLCKETEGALPESPKTTFSKPFVCLFPPKMLRLHEGGTRALCPQVWPVRIQPGSMQPFGICERTWFVFSANLSGTVLTPYATFLWTVIETIVRTRCKYVKANSA